MIHLHAEGNKGDEFNRLPGKQKSSLKLQTETQGIFIDAQAHLGIDEFARG